MFYIFDIANNHQGSLSHCFNIIDGHYKIIKKYNIDAAFKLQFRQLGTFLAQSYKNSDKKFIKRFRETELSKEDFKAIVEYIRYNTDCQVAATPFDNESLEWIKEFDIDIVKIASCSVDDWPLLEEAVKINKKFVISTAGATEQTLRSVYKIFTSANRDFSLLHCVAEYPTPVEHANLSRITMLQEWFPDVEIGYSTHETPDGKTADYAIALGAKIIEKHIGLARPFGINDYSLTPVQLDDFLFKSRAETALKTTDPKADKLLDLKRHIFIKQAIKEGTQIKESDLYFAIPCLTEDLGVKHYCVSELDEVLGLYVMQDLNPNQPLTSDMLYDHKTRLLDVYKKQINELLSSAKVTVVPDNDVELSCHYGIDKFDKYGCCSVSKINRDYCKKIIVVLPGQFHPPHHHKRKEETFELLWGDCCVIVNDMFNNLKPGQSITIMPLEVHAFQSKSGCVFEEISTHHYNDDSFYDDSAISKKTREERKIKIQ